MEKETRELYNVSLSFYMPQEGTVTVAARDTGHAEELVRELFDKHKDVDIVDIYPVSDINMGDDTDTEEEVSYN